jgi:predicted amidophosphoribosyltransferase
MSSWTEEIWNKVMGKLQNLAQQDCCPLCGSDMSGGMDASTQICQDCGCVVVSANPVSICPDCGGQMDQMDQMDSQDMPNMPMPGM